MDNKERLEEIKRAYSYGYKLPKDTYPYWLIERVQELEEENKRYREVIQETLQAMGMVDRQKYGSKLEKALEELG